MVALKKARYSFVTVLLFALMWFGTLGHRDLFDPDEGRYAGIPAAMVDTGDWLTPRLNDFKYFEKPVLQYWGTAIAFELFGKSNASARLFTALLGFVSALFAMLVALRLYGERAAAYTFLTGISYFMVVVFGHYLTLDMALSAFVTMGIGSLVIAQYQAGNPRQTRNWMLTGWAMLALASLTKGLVAIVLPAATVVVYSLWQRDWGLWKKLYIGKGLLLYLLIAAPWIIAVSRANPEFAKFFFIHEHLDRYLSNVHNREGPVYYFVPFLLLGVCPWLLTSLRTLILPSFKWRPETPGSFNAERFMWTFVVVTFVFFSMGHSKLPGYILPILPIIAILAGGQIIRKGVVDADRWIMLVLGGILLIGALNIKYLASTFFPVELWQGYAPWLLASGSLLVASSAVLLIKKNWELPVFTSVAFTSMLATLLLVTGSNSLAESRSTRAVADAIAKSLPADAPVFSFLNFPESAVFYLGRPTTVIMYKGELAMGIEAEPEKFIKSKAEFMAIWRNLEQAAVVLKVNRLPELDLKALHGRIVYKGPKTMVIIKS